MKRKQEMENINGILKQYSPIQKLDWSAEQSLVLKEAKVTYVSVLLLGAFVKVADPAARALGVVNAYRFMTNELGLSLADLPDILVKKVSPMLPS